jgi:threonine dehydrogenase-like Zn-dependent dehydrogenase
MKAICMTPGTKTLRLEERPEPRITAPDEIKVRVLEVGICGTDREETSGGRALAPKGQKEMIIGHEMLGQVLETGRGVSRVRPGDLAVFTVRRGCKTCLPCMMNRLDMCLSGQFGERGIWGLDGYQCQYAVDREPCAVHVPPELADIGVLVEPLSVAEKAIDEALRIQFARLPSEPASLAWFSGRRCLVAGLGPVGLLAALALRLRGAEVFGLDVVDENTSRPRWLSRVGGIYVDGRKVPPDRVGQQLGTMDLIFEATGVASLEFNLLDALGLNGIYVLTGIPGGERPLRLDGADLIRQLVLGNQAMVGSVNAARDHFQMAVDDLLNARLRWQDALGELITHRYPYADFAMAFERHGQDDIKVVVEWGSFEPAGERGP